MGKLGIKIFEILEPDFKLVFSYIYTGNCSARQEDFQGRQVSRGSDIAQAQGFPEPSK